MGNKNNKLEECQEVVREEAKRGRGQCNQSLLNAARLVEAVARATIKHFSCNKLKLKADQKNSSESARKGHGSGEGAREKSSLQQLGANIMYIM